MKTLHFYLTRQVVGALGLTVFVFTFVLVLGNGIREVLELLVKHQATLGVAVHATLLLVPYVLAFSLPIGMLTAALLVFGRFSADQELTAARASGISLLSMVTPILLLSVAVSAVCAWLNFEIAPASRMAYKELLFHTATERPTIALQNNEPMIVGAYSISAAKIAEDGVSLTDVIVTQDDTNGLLQVWAHGTTGTIKVDKPQHQILITLQHADGDQRQHGDVWATFVNDAEISLPIPFDPATQNELQTPLSDMTLAQLLHRKHQIEREMAVEPLAGKSVAELRQTRQQLRENIGSRAITPALVYLHRQVAFSFACIGFTLIGIPLGVRGHRRETSVGVAIALGLMLVYYSFIVLGQAWIGHPERGPQFIVWLPNFIFQAAGAVLLWRANRGI
ncbi:MAG TPA: LptF/LptG family permease [Verrucomicrobiae bacterium]|nr:LptF/LptG family permease [Verrucomicrobiae bacterium]